LKKPCFAGFFPLLLITWGTVWSTQKWTDKKGKMDSIYLVDDILLRDGKILEVDEKQRQYPVPKMKKM
jgi:hypothetical protein